MICINEIPPSPLQENRNINLEGAGPIASVFHRGNLGGLTRDRASSDSEIAVGDVLLDDADERGNSADNRHHGSRIS